MYLFKPPIHTITCWQERDIFKYMLESDVDNGGVLDFLQFKAAVKFALKKLKAEKMGKNHVISS
jgi:hypothetical protein